MTPIIEKPIATAIEKSITTAILGIRTVLLGNGASKFMLLVFEFWLAAKMGASGFGLYAIALAILQLTATLCLFGLNFGVIQHIAIYQTENDLKRRDSAISLTLIATAFFGLLGAGLVASLTDFLVTSVFHKSDLALPLLIAAFIIPVETSVQAMNAVFRGLRKFTLAVTTGDLIRNTLSLVVLPLLYGSGVLGLIDVMGLYFIGTLSGFCFGVYKLHQGGHILDLRKIDWDVLPKIFGFSWLLFLWNILQVLATRMMVLASGVFLSAQDTGAIALASRFTLCLIFLQSAVNATVQAEFAQFHHQKNTQGQSALYQSMTQGLLGVGIVMLLLLLADPSYVLSLVGDDYASYAAIVLIMVFGTFSNVVTGPAGQILVATERQKTMMHLTLCDVAMQVLLVFPLMKYFGVMGAALGEAVRIVLFVLIRLWIINRTGVSPLSPSWLYILWAGMLGSLVSYSLNQLMIDDAHTFGRYAMTLIPSLAVYGVAVLFIIKNDPRLHQDVKTILTLRPRPARDTSQ